jgi:hypothetical protein
VSAWISSLKRDFAFSTVFLLLERQRVAVDLSLTSHHAANALATSDCEPFHIICPLV